MIDCGRIDCSGTACSGTDSGMTECGSTIDCCGSTGVIGCFGRIGSGSTGCEVAGFDMDSGMIGCGGSTDC